MDYDDWGATMETNEYTNKMDNQLKHKLISKKISEMKQEIKDYHKLLGYDVEVYIELKYNDKA